MKRGGELTGNKKYFGTGQSGALRLTCVDRGGGRKCVEATALVVGVA